MPSASACLRAYLDCAVSAILSCSEFYQHDCPSKTSRSRVTSAKWRAHWKKRRNEELIGPTKGCNNSYWHLHLVWKSYQFTHTNSPPNAIVSNPYTVSGT